jgi:hypothetical protein
VPDDDRHPPRLRLTVQIDAHERWATNNGNASEFAMLFYESAFKQMFAVGRN